MAIRHPRKLETLYEEEATYRGGSWEFPLTAVETRARLYDVIEFENGTYREELHMNEDVIKDLVDENKKLTEVLSFKFLTAVRVARLWGRVRYYGP